MRPSRASPDCFETLSGVVPFAGLAGGHPVGTPCRHQAPAAADHGRHGTRLLLSDLPLSCVALRMLEGFGEAFDLFRVHPDIPAFIPP
jgi:hypothetical protein